ncbi:recombination protein RecT [Escherichia coli]|uniref:recombination protein RecT n=1 Tax=Escherichia coli TaxID=562 RepID=UPI0007A64223|nr:recombination protein RecT [Escherichia coli]HAH7828598.1 recombination protein RecT [Escherichia coli]
MTKQPPIAKADLQKTQGNRASAAVKNESVIHMLNRPSMKKQLAVALPRHMTADRMIRIAMTEIRKVPELAECDEMSFISAIVQCSQLGLEPGSALGHAYLLPFCNGKAKDSKKNVQLIVGYRGMIDLARRSGQITSLSARVVREGDEFSYELGLDEKLVHRPGENEDAPITHVYAVAKLKGGGAQFEVMTKKQVEKVRDTHSKAAKNAASKGGVSIWEKHFEDMAQKTVIRKLFKYLPVSIEIQRAVSMDEKEVEPINLDDMSVIPGEYSVIDDSEE